MAQSPSLFKYQPLTGSSAIRLVILEPGLGQDPVRCRLIHVSLDDNPQYEALSYAWGDPSATKPICLEGKTLQVTENLESALLNLRDESVDNPKERVLWIDAICINQLHIPERNDQVQRMRDIYGNATLVLIWIGRYHEEVDALALRDVETWGIHALVEGSREQTMKIFEFMANVFKLSSEDENEMQVLIASATKQDWAHLERLLRRPWFERLWVVQEVYLARKTLLICGRVECEWNEFSHACQFIGLSKLASFTASSSVVNSAMIVLLRNLTHFACTDPRDRLYALLGICCDGEDLNVDYSKSVQEVYADWAWSHIKETSRLEVFSLGNITISLAAGLPSWVPSIQPGRGAVFDVDMLLFYSTLAMEISEEAEEPYRYSASRFSLSDGSVSTDSLRLILSGTAVGRITGIFDIQEVDEPDTEDNIVPAYSTPSLEYLAGLRISTIRDLEMKVAQHFALSELIYASPLWCEFTEALFRGLENTSLQMFHGQTDDIPCRYAVLRGYEPIPCHFKKGLDLEARKSDYLVTMKLVVHMIAHRIRIFVTAKGRLGLATLSSNVQVGDEVYVLLGETRRTF
ncbi:heterokaryon incompatibility protein-domain-containing protein [Rhexocercosporidium sp. MPI-PUGE-AT-0058]|nr:heterokaryon incompatibility protein-domain-containing protein [Rhexocercosporidium sp. MPI-PUGE-AT-0058]